jgi:hypothetical protein
MRAYQAASNVKSDTNQKVILIGEVDWNGTHIYKAFTKLIPSLTVNKITNLAMGFQKNISLNETYEAICEGMHDISKSLDSEKYNMLSDNIFDDIHDYIYATTSIELFDEVRNNSISFHNLDIKMEDLSSYIEEDKVLEDNLNLGLARVSKQVCDKNFPSFNEDKYDQNDLEVNNYIGRLLWQHCDVLDLLKQKLSSNYISRRSDNFALEIDNICKSTNSGIVMFVDVFHLNGIHDKLAYLGYNNVKSFYLFEGNSNNPQNDFASKFMYANFDLFSAIVMPKTKIINNIDTVQTLVDFLKPKIIGKDARRRLSFAPAAEKELS